MHKLVLPLLAMATPAMAQPACIPKPYHIEGNSLAPTVPNNSMLTVLTGPDCPLASHIRHGSLVIFTSGAAAKPVIKFVRGREGDTLTLESTPTGLHARLNGTLLTTTSGQLYTWQPPQANMLTLALTPSGTIPSGALLVLGEDPTGTLDSTRFGLIATTDVIGVAAKRF